ncbi:methyltransferase-like protein [Elysia marginata]|uniref:tRNA N(3)-methylcytidine methyltransferase n=1 Tax=Elysia marginata TaxID=1093978 RepID=A0AAV4FDH3_9GAST|nr:methyltransferase-like protein [Elysia marginata]
MEATPEKASQNNAEESDKRQKFGTRYLTDAKNVFQHNAWDNVSWDEDQEAAARDIASKQAQKAVSQEKRDEYEKEAAAFWDKFYGVHSNHFFKDRHWLFTEFPELYGIDKNFENINCDQELSICGENGLLDKSSADPIPGSSDKPQGCSDPSSQSANSNNCQPDCQYSPCNLLEVGCGVGNTVFPVLKTNKNPNLMVYCCDFSSTAIDIVKAHPEYDSERCLAFVLDITDPVPQIPFAPESLDLIVMIFVLSAVCPEKMQEALNRLASYLKPGGMLLFRDYGRYDMAQLRFKEGRCLSENFYVRGDGTRVYFFTQDELRIMFEQAGLVEKENLIDRRLQGSILISNNNGGGGDDDNKYDDADASAAAAAADDDNENDDDT